MNLTNKKLKQLIQEELKAVLKESQEESWMDRNQRMNPAMSDKGSSFKGSHMPEPALSEKEEIEQKIRELEGYLEDMGDSHSGNFDRYELEDMISAEYAKLRQLESGSMKEAKSGDSNIQQIINQMLGMPEDMVNDAIAQYKAQKEKKDK